MPQHALMKTEKCRAQHYSTWLIEPVFLTTTVANIRSGIHQPMTQEGDGSASGDPYEVVDGVAVINLSGPLMKGWSKYGGTSTVDARGAVRKAVKDESVKAILLHVDSPGGTVAGTSELASDVRAANDIKPVFAHVEDLCASAAYWVASQARNIQATSTSEIGSIGVVMQVADTSGYYAKEGVQVHTLSTGPYKGAGFDGNPVTDEHLEYFQSRLEDIFGHFTNAVKSGRGMSIENVRAAADGRVFSAKEALDKGLIDGIGSRDDTMQMVKKVVAARDLAAAKAMLADDAQDAATDPKNVEKKAPRTKSLKVPAEPRQIEPDDALKQSIRAKFGLDASSEVSVARCEMDYTGSPAAAPASKGTEGVKDAAADPHWFKARITTGHLDWDGEVLIPQGGIATAFEKSGSIFWNHNYDLAVARPVGKTVRGENDWTGEGRFAERPSDYVGDFYPDYVRALVSQKIFKGVSVGFLPIESRRPTAKDKEVYGDGVKRVTSKWVMLEWSFCPLQCNINAVVLESVKKGLVSPSAALEMFPDAFGDDEWEAILAQPFNPHAMIGEFPRKARAFGVVDVKTKTVLGPPVAETGGAGGSGENAPKRERVVVFVSGGKKKVARERVSIVRVTDSAQRALSRARGRCFEQD